MIKSTRQLNSIRATLAVALTLLPWSMANAGPVDQLEAHQNQYHYIKNPQKLQGAVFYERVWLLIRAVGANVSEEDEAIYRKRLKKVWDQRAKDVCSPQLETVSATLVANYYYSDCSPPPNPDPPRIVIISKGEAKFKWFEDSSSSREVPSEELPAFLEEARQGKGVLLVENEVGVLIETGQDSLFVDAELSEALVLAGVMSPGSGAGGIVELGYSLNEPSQVERLELLSLADARGAENILEMTKILVSTRQFTDVVEHDPNIPLDINPALKTIAGAARDPSALTRYSALANRHSDLGNLLLHRTLTNHEDELPSITLELNLENEHDDDPIVMEKVTPKKLQNGAISVSPRSKIQAENLRGFEIIQK